MTQSIAALPPSAPFRDPDSAPPVIERDAQEQANFWSSDEGASFWDALDAVNPLHHIPVVSSIYRAVSGDEIGLGPRLIGAAIFGGPLGIILAGISALFEEASGGNIAEHVVALFEDSTGGGESAPADEIATLLDHAEGDASEVTQTSAAAQADVAEHAVALFEDPAGGGSAPADEIATLLDHAEGDASEVTQTSAAAQADVAERAKSPTTQSAIAASRVHERPLAATATDVPSPSAGSVLSSGAYMIGTESKRVAQASLQSQRAQADLLLANVRGHEPVTPRHADGGEDGDDEERGPHSNLPPAGATSAWYTDAMRRALDKYRSDHGAPTGGR